MISWPREPSGIGEPVLNYHNNWILPRQLRPAFYSYTIPLGCRRFWPVTTFTSCGATGFWVTTKSTWRRDCQTLLVCPVKTRMITTEGLSRIPRYFRSGFSWLSSFSARHWRVVAHLTTLVQANYQARYLGRLPSIIFFIRSSALRRISIEMRWTVASNATLEPIQVWPMRNSAKACTTMSLLLWKTVRKCAGEYRERSIYRVWICYGKSHLAGNRPNSKILKEDIVVSSMEREG